ncbi:cell adhesion molecule 3 isoform X1 [Nerophis ophidion]|uniref:cell adhesion molecule 3 isoform X1 n=1 Tax=Nerophis ophidion TaxID=159077 RepID=UPI002ADF9AFB|nr:cell adhesion molecule 3 isoform X1 [Nerophis ophidion]
MASAGILLWLLITICVSGQTTRTNSFVTVECKMDNVGKYGNQSMLNCGIVTAKEARDATVMMVTWKKDGVLLLGFEKPSKLNESPRFSFTKSWSMKNMNVSLLIANTSVADQGEYTCEVVTDRGRHETSANLSVAARYSQPTILYTPMDVSPKSQVTLTCSSEGGYPEGRLGWFLGPTRKEFGDSKTEVNVTRNGLFHLSSKLNVPPEMTASEYTCKVYNANGGEDDKATLISPKKSQRARRRKFTYRQGVMRRSEAAWSGSEPGGRGSRRAVGNPVGCRRTRLDHGRQGSHCQYTKGHESGIQRERAKQRRGNHGEGNARRDAYVKVSDVLANVPRVCWSLCRSLSSSSDVLIVD